MGLDAEQILGQWEGGAGPMKLVVVKPLDSTVRGGAVAKQERSLPSDILCIVASAQGNEL